MRAMPRFALFLGIIFLIGYTGMTDYEYERRKINLALWELHKRIKEMKDDAEAQAVFMEMKEKLYMDFLELQRKNEGPKD